MADLIMIYWMLETAENKIENKIETMGRQL